MQKECIFWRFCLFVLVFLCVCVCVFGGGGGGVFGWLVGWWFVFFFGLFWCFLFVLIKSNMRGHETIRQPKRWKLGLKIFPGMFVS